MKRKLKLQIQSQPTNTTCGPTCLAAVYDYFDQPTDLVDLADTIGELDSGGTLAVHLACDALRRGFQAEITAYNLQLFDPTWFTRSGEMRSANFLSDKLNQQFSAKEASNNVDQYRLGTATKFYSEFLNLGGRLRMQPLDEELIVSILDRDTPILCGLSATYLYQESRERSDGSPDDITGEPTGHFVVLHGYDRTTRSVWIADPLPHHYSNAVDFSAALPTNENSDLTSKYLVPLSRVMAAILLGIVTYDASLLTLSPNDCTGAGVKRLQS